GTQTQEKIRTGIKNNVTHSILWLWRRKSTGTTKGLSPTHSSRYKQFPKQWGAALLMSWLKAG
ncbi:hypothetical protein U2075_14975, partial [Listeria monocytogenes]|uniref:hypothetical protein n=1 Tax=Listeria monocytogenes TaxID=1639 RepID=UPI002FDC3CB9